MSKAMIAGFLGVAVLFAVGRSMSTQEDDKNVSVKGFVLDAAGKALPDTEILIIVSSVPGRPIPTKTDNNGFYEKSFKAGDSFDISYSHTDAGLSMVNKLSGNKKQDISVILYKRNQIAKMPFDAVLSELMAYEYASVRVRLGEPDATMTAWKNALAGNKTSERVALLRKRLTKSAGTWGTFYAPRFDQVQKMLYFGDN